MMLRRKCCQWLIGCLLFQIRLFAADLQPPVTYHHWLRKNPNLSIFVTQVNLADSRVTVRVSRAGDDPDGDGPWSTTLLPVREIANREKFDIAVNGDFFRAQNTQDVEGANTGFVKGKLATPLGPAMTDGLVWHQPAAPCPCLEIANGRASITLFKPGALLSPSTTQLIGGSTLLVSSGKRIVHQGGHLANYRHPRTAVGLDKTGTLLTLLVVDGRQPDLSIGMTLSELADEFVVLGCDSALNLDGGGSSTLVYRNPKDHRLQVLNSPSDTKERSVAEILGVTVAGALPVPE